MQIYGYPGERVDFVSASGSAGSILFGDSRALCEEFFGAPHAVNQAGTESSISYFNGAITLEFSETEAQTGVSSVVIRPGLSREKITVFINKEQVVTEEETVRISK